MKPKDYVVSCYCVHEGKVALIYHNKLRMWLPLGGHIEPGETPRAAVIREVLEESGLDVVLEPEHETPMKRGSWRALMMPDELQEEYIDEQHNHLNFVYFVEVRNGELQHIEQEKHAEIRWWNAAELQQSELHPRIQDQALRALEKFSQ